MTLVGSSHRSALRNNYKQQAYFTALSAVRVVAAGINQEEDFPIPSTPGGYIEINLDLPENSMGDVEVSIRLEAQDEILIVAEGNYLEVKDTVSLRLVSSGGIWKVLRYER